MGWQQPGHVGLDAFLHVRRQGQSPIIEQTVIDTGRTMLFGTKVAYQQDLSTFLDTIGLALTIAILHTRFVTAAKTIGLTVQPGKPVLCAQTGQAMAKQACSQAFQQRHLRQWEQFGG
jgi:hypothetical protein